MLIKLILNRKINKRRELSLSRHGKEEGEGDSREIQSVRRTQLGIAGFEKPAARECEQPLEVENDLCLRILKNLHRTELCHQPEQA